MEQLPRDVLFYLSQWLSFSDLINLTRVSKALRKLVEHERVWQNWTLLNFGQVRLTDLEWPKPLVTWKEVGFVFNRERRKWPHELPKDCDGIAWPLLFRTPERCMLIPFASSQFIRPRRGDIIIAKDKFDWELSYFSGGLNSRIATQQTKAPVTFAYPEFPPHYFFHRDKKLINIKLTEEMIDEMIEFRTVSIPGYPRIPVPYYEYPLALLPNISVMTYCPANGALDEV